MLLFDTAPFTRQFHMLDLTPCTTQGFDLSHSDDFNALALVLFVSQGETYGSPATPRRHLYLIF